MEVLHSYVQKLFDSEFAKHCIKMAPLAFAVMISATVIQLFEELVCILGVDTVTYSFWVDFVLVLIMLPACVVVVACAFASKNIPNRAESAVTVPVGVILGTVMAMLSSEVRALFINMGVDERTVTDDGGVYFTLAFIYLIIITIMAVALSAWGALVVEKQDILEQAIVDVAKSKEIRAKAAFARIDDDQSGRLREAEVRDVFANMQTETQKFEESELSSMTQMIMLEVDIDKNGWLEEDEFVKAMINDKSKINQYLEECKELKTAKSDTGRYSPMMQALGRIVGSALAVPVALAWSAIAQESVLTSLKDALIDSYGDFYGSLIACGFYGVLAHAFAVIVSSLYLRFVRVHLTNMKSASRSEDRKSYVGLEAKGIIIEKIDFLVNLTLLFFIRFSYYTIVSYAAGLHANDISTDFEVDFIFAFCFFILCCISAQVKVMQGKENFPIGIELMISTLPLNFGSAFKSVYLDPVSYMDADGTVYSSILCIIVLIVELGILTAITIRNIQTSKDIIIEEFRADIRVGQLVHKAKAAFLQKINKNLTLTTHHNPLQAGEPLEIESSSSTYKLVDSKNMYGT